MKVFSDISKIVSGDELAFQRFMEFYASRLYYHAYGILGNKEIAEEVVSDVFFEVWKNRSGLSQIENLNAFLQTITYRKSISCLRKEQSRKNLDVLEILDNFYFQSIQSPDEEIISKEEIDKINRAIQQLPPKCKQVFFLAKIEGLPYKQIAEVLNVSLPTISYHVAYALRFIAQSIGITVI